MKWKSFLLSFAIILLLGISFVSPWIQPLWQAIDTAIFKFLNSNLLCNKPLQYFWAAVNHKRMDLIEDGVFLLFFIWGIKTAPPSMRLRRCAEFLFCILLAGSVIYFVNRHFLRAHVIFPRESPSLVITPCIRISQEISWKHVKDETLASFPGDHATTLLLFGFLYSAFVERRLALTAWIYVCFRMLPRLIMGAHWFSDIAVGSLSIALFFVACFLYTPLGTLIIGWLEKSLPINRRRLSSGNEEKSI